ncbi:hypothetical protein JCM33374_g960 [Metschnikowia sp. JCM 33374]|nr:hypothetical protein JCM33374_g960 [Metschnikowia sp. JCM 33374]
MTPTNLRNQDPPVKKNAFVHKLYSMLNEERISHLIWWSGNPAGSTFSLYPGKEFAYALSKYFKHGNVASFVRQLHMYGFHKVSDPQPGNGDQAPLVWEFRHSSGKFRQGDESSLAHIKRRSQTNPQRNSLVETSSGVVAQSSQQNGFSGHPPPPPPGLEGSPYGYTQFPPFFPPRNSSQSPQQLYPAPPPPPPPPPHSSISHLPPRIPHLPNTHNDPTPNGPYPPPVYFSSQGIPIYPQFINPHYAPAPLPGSEVAVHYPSISRNGSTHAPYMLNPQFSPPAMVSPVNTVQPSPTGYPPVSSPHPVPYQIPSLANPSVHPLSGYGVHPGFEMHGDKKHSNTQVPEFSPTSQHSTPYAKEESVSTVLKPMDRTATMSPSSSRPSSVPSVRPSSLPSVRSSSTVRPSSTRRGTSPELSSKPGTPSEENPVTESASGSVNSSSYSSDNSEKRDSVEPLLPFRKPFDSTISRRNRIPSLLCDPLATVNNTNAIDTVLESTVTEETKFPFPRMPSSLGSISSSKLESFAYSRDRQSPVSSIHSRSHSSSLLNPESSRSSSASQAESDNMRKVVLSTNNGKSVVDRIRPSLVEMYSGRPPLSSPMMQSMESMRSPSSSVFSNHSSISSISSGRYSSFGSISHLAPPVSFDCVSPHAEIPAPTQMAPLPSLSGASSVGTVIEERPNTTPEVEQDKVEGPTFNSQLPKVAFLLGSPNDKHKKPKLDEG